ncbi:NAD(P)-binding protein [Sodiomyces alkalinus F11]|uniref:NAD(P)-binding protein n=1 Tax=Sodiomyces alkalinus (strain CBS 110278 / VKM F-3762 / F11) TaxID=1314773 RepID=A0A3N2Q8D7_SODAK|nr:NAD(P)-binding protein [Sodiomyces alkalinus F11]ROT42885.1 NAD(P)-binding protein [Sodiomyces alkalinus F11]
MDLKTVLVTGCSAGGIGAAIALALAKRGHHVFATARMPSKIPSELSDLANVTVLSLDVTSPSSIADAVKAVADLGRGLDVLLNNAGAGYAMPVLDVDIDRAKQVYETNLWGPIRTIQAFSDLLIAHRGRVVNLSTCGAVVNTPWIAAYTSSKAALNQFSETLRLELSPFGVSVVTIMAGVVDSHFHANDSNFVLPEGSRYAPIQEIIAGWASGASKPKGCSAVQFADALVQEITGTGKNGLVFRGPHAGGINFLSRWAPRSATDAAMSYNQGLGELSKTVAGNAKK